VVFVKEQFPPGLYWPVPLAAQVDHASRNGTVADRSGSPGHFTARGHLACDRAEPQPKMITAGL
jgi:hypothetical protein